MLDPVSLVYEDTSFVVTGVDLKSRYFESSLKTGGLDILIYR